MKSLLTRFFFVLLCLTMMQSVLAQELYKVTVQQQNVRTKPLASGKVMGTLLKDETIEVKSIEGVWARIVFKKKVGYVPASSLEKIPQQVKIEQTEAIKSSEQVVTLPIKEPIKSEIPDSPTVDYNTTKAPSNTTLESDTESTKTKYRDFTFGIASNSLSVNIGNSDNDEGLCRVVGIGVSTGSVKVVSLILGLGLQIHNDMDDFIIIGNIYPYLGGSYTSYDKKSKFNFSYGAAAMAKIGFNVYTSGNGHRHFLTIGYGINAYEFKTNDLFRNGEWQLGLTIAM